MTTAPTKIKLPRNVERFCSTIDAALELVDQHLGDYCAKIVKHKDRGQGVIFSQIQFEREGSLLDLPTDQLAFVYKDGVGAAAEDGPILAFGKEQSPEKVAALFVAALLTGNPIAFPECDCCSGDS